MTEQTAPSAIPPTPEQLAAQAAAAVQKVADEKAAKKAEAEKLKAEKKAASEKEKAEKKAASEAEKAKLEAAKKAKADAKAAAEAAKVTSKQPEQNGVRRPKPDGACGKVWANADSLSASMGQPVPIAMLSAACAGINDSTIRTQYALWRKFNGVTGRVTPPVVIAPAVPEATPDASGAAPAA